MRALAEAYPEEQFVQQVVGQIPWSHNLMIINKIKERSEREWYIRQTIASGWSRNVLVMQIGSGLYRRKGKSSTNFSRTVPSPQSELAAEILKDPLNFDFLTLAEDARERDLHKGLLAHLRETPRDDCAEDTPFLFARLRSTASLIWNHGRVFDFNLKFIYKRSVIFGIRPSVDFSFAGYRNQPIRPL